MTTRQFQESSALRIFLSYFKPHRKLFFLDMCCALMIAVIDLAFPYVSRWCMYQLLPESAYRTFFAVMAVVFCAYILRSVFTYIICYYGHTFGILVEADIRRDLFRHMQELSFDYYDRNRTGQLMSRLTADLFDITELAHHGPEDIFISGVTIVGALAIMFTIQWQLALVIACIIPVFFLVVWKCRKSMQDASIKVKQRTATINADIESGLSGIKTAKAFANEEAELQDLQAGVPPGHGPVQRGDGVLPVHPLRGGDLRGRLPHHAGPDGHGGPHHLQPVYHDLREPGAQALHLCGAVCQRHRRLCPVCGADAGGACHAGCPRCHHSFPGGGAHRRGPCVLRLSG